jgi:CubicO group peptidase (beta-lactamase class C family)
MLKGKNRTLKKKILAQVLGSICLMYIIISFFYYNHNSYGRNMDYWPTNKWRTSTPEAQGMDSKQIYHTMEAFINYKEDSTSLFDSMLIIRNGYIVSELYSPTKNKDARQIIHSTTKSITSALMGIAIEDGYIANVNAKLWNTINHDSTENTTPFKEQITIKHLLTMSSGFEWNEFGLIKDSDNSADNMYHYGDLVHYVLNQPVTVEPGTTFNYNSGGSVLLSQIIAEQTGTNTLSYAKQKLFDPLGITDYDWQLFNGTANGASYLSLTARDMAKIGYLYLKKGKWNNKQIVPAHWVEESTRKQITGPQIDDQTDLQSNGYGYQWWTNSFGGYSARGQYGQYIFVMPELNIVAVFQSHLSDRTRDFEIPLNIMVYGIIESIKSSKPLPPNNNLAEMEKVLLNQQIPPDEGWREWE